MRRFLHAKIHRATITHADINYEGSITMPPSLLKAANIAEFEAVWIWNVTNGNRFETYTIFGEDAANSDQTAKICVNGAAARLVSPGDIVIIAAFTFLDQQQMAGHKPEVVFVDRKNAVVRQEPEQAFKAA